MRAPTLPTLPALLALLALLTTARPLPAQQQPPEPSGLALAVALEQTLVDVIARCEKSVVAIALVKAGGERPTVSILGLRNPIRLGPRFQPIVPSRPTDPDFIPHDYGTGVVIDRGGLILTQYHVLGETDDHWVTTAGGKTYRATIKAADPRSGLAVLSIDATDLVPIRFGDAAGVRKGQIVIALGNPYAIARDGQASASWGIVANIARKAGPLPRSEFSDGEPVPTKSTLHHFGTLIQTDAKLNLGTSGGALVNLRGEMIGLTTSLAALAGYEQAAGYAVPINQPIRRVIEVLKQGREVEHGLLGVGLGSPPRGSLPRLTEGVVISQVLPGTPASRAGLRAGDILTHVDDEAVTDTDALMLRLGQLPAATNVRLRFLRKDNVHSVQVRLAKFPVVGTKIVTQSRPAWRGLHVDYATAVATYQQHVGRGEVDVQGCIRVTKVDEGSPAWIQGLREGMFVSHVEDRQIVDPPEFLRAVDGRDGAVRLRLTLPADQQPVRTIPPAS